MKVSDLIAKLQGMPQDAEIIITKSVGDGYTEDLAIVSDPWVWTPFSVRIQVGDDTKAQAS